MSQLKNLWVFLLLTLLMAGCSSKEQQLHLTLQEREALKTILQGKPTRLKEVINEELDSTAKQDVQQSQNPQVREEYSTKEIVSALFAYTDQEILLPDESFENISRVIGNKETSDDGNYATVFSKYLKDEGFACKEPSYFRYFQNRYNAVNELFCEEAVPFKVLSRLGKDKISWIDPKRVSSIHILFAGKGEAMMSQYGHISMRFIVCPEDDYSEEACNTNLYEHLVVGYRAHINELKIDTIKGLLGDYRAYLYANDFMDIYQEYAISEFRDLYSLPLKLSKRQREDIVRTMSEIHWSYSGDYKFLTKNCSTLMQGALASVWEELSDDPSMNEMYWRPDNFFAALKGSSLAESKRLEDLKLAEEEGYYFPSTGPVYEKALNVIFEAMDKPYFTDLEEYISYSPKIRYEKMINDISLYERVKNDAYLRNAQLLLEELSMIRYEARMMAEMTSYFEQNDINEIKKHMQQVLDMDGYKAFSNCMLEPIMALTKPVKKMTGIPKLSDLSEDEDKKHQCDSLENQKYMKEVRLQLEHIDSENWIPIKLAMYFWLESINNIKRLTQL